MTAGGVVVGEPAMPRPKLAPAFSCTSDADHAAAEDPSDVSTPSTCSNVSEAGEAETEDSDSDFRNRFEREETVFIFDWDDTVVPSTWLHDNALAFDGSVPWQPEHQEQLAQLAASAAKTLRLAKLLGTVVLVTNAERGWIELSCQRFLPCLYPLLENVKMLSARSAYERADRTNPFDWKLLAFGTEIGRIFNNDLFARHRRRQKIAPRRNVLSLGDSAHEREAVFRTTACIQNCRTKSLKFADKPTVEQLCRQHQLVSRCLRRIVHHDGDLDLCISAS
mmetsp:Transcript_105549/g.303550  ORF Transcript_105549/g.303550 Transcript_105549/m.303550 type:complete len:279 (+) Transcript_105549:59-895(+)